MNEISKVNSLASHGFFWGLILAVSLFIPATASADSFGNVNVIVEEDLKGESTHGYVELWFIIENKSETSNHEVKLTLPKSTSSGYGDYIRAVTRTVSVEVGKTVRVSLAYPVNQFLGGSGVGVTVDGKEYDAPLSFRDLSRGGSYGMPMRGGSYTSYTSSSSASVSGLVLCSNSVDPKFIDRANPFGVDGGRVRAEEDSLVKIPGGPGSQPVEFTESGRMRPFEFFRPKLNVLSWSPNWLGYSRYDGIVVTAEDMRGMPAEVRSAIGQYVECGGTLLIFGHDAPLPGNWKPVPIGILPLSGCAAGFGHCFISSEKDYVNMNRFALKILQTYWQRNLDPWQRPSSPPEANKAFPIIKDMLGVPIWGFLTLMLLFSVVIGPVNMHLLAKRKRKLWLFWTVPLISFITCVMVLGYMLFSEGTEGKVRVETFTVLDENTRRASTIGWLAVYTPMLGSGGLHFSPQTEVTYQNSDSSSVPYGHRQHRSGSALTIDWTRDQHLASGWQTPRVPSHFVVRKSERRLERVTIAAESEGKPQAVNGLGAEITELWYMDEKGAYFSAHNIPAGGKATLKPESKPRDTEKKKALNIWYSGREWYNLTDRLKISGPEFLTPRTYLAFMDAVPFLDESASKGAEPKTKSVIFGIMKEGNDGG
jgi:hypothetical protein